MTSIGPNHLEDEELLRAAEVETLSPPSKNHLENCSPCKAEVETLRDSLGIIAGVLEPDLSPMLRRRLIARFDKRKKSKSLTRTVLCWKIPVYQAAGFLIAFVLMWQVVAHRLNESKSNPIQMAVAPSFVVAQSDFNIVSR